MSMRDQERMKNQKEEAADRQKPTGVRFPRTLGGEMTSPSEVGQERNFSGIDMIQERLVNRRERLIDELQKVEKALQILGSDSRVHELKQVLYDLGI